MLETHSQNYFTNTCPVLTCAILTRFFTKIQQYFCIHGHDYIPSLPFLSKQSHSTVFMFHLPLFYPKMLTFETGIINSRSYISLQTHNILHRYISAVSSWSNSICQTDQALFYYISCMQISISPFFLSSTCWHISICLFTWCSFLKLQIFCSVSTTPVSLCLCSFFSTILQHSLWVTPLFSWGLAAPLYWHLFVHFFHFFSKTSFYF